MPPHPKDPVVITTIAPDSEKIAQDITVPVLSPILARKKTLAEEIAAIDVAKLTCPKLPKKQDDLAASASRNSLSANTRSPSRRRQKKSSRTTPSG